MSAPPRTPSAFDDDFEPVLDDPENPEWTEEDFARAVRPEEFPEWIFEAFPNTPRPVRGSQKSATKTPISLRVDAEILEQYRATGPGWQSRMNEVLRKGAPGV